MAKFSCFGCNKRGTNLEISQYPGKSEEETQNRRSKAKELRLQRKVHVSRSRCFS